MFDVKFGHGDSRNPDEMVTCKNVMHTNSITSWLWFKDRWYRLNTSSTWPLKKMFDDCKTEEEQEIVFELMRNGNYIDLDL